jgi:hypothetical protein
MEQPEVPMEAVHEHIHEHAHGAKETWISLVALVTAILAAFAAISSLLAGDNANEAMINQIKSSDQWAYYQAKGIKAAILNSKIEMVTIMGKTPSPADKAKAATYGKEQKDIFTLATELKEEAEGHLEKHIILARSVTLFQVAIAVAAICILTKRRLFFYFSLVAGTIGIVLLWQGYFHQHVAAAEGEEAKPASGEVKKGEPGGEKKGESSEKKSESSEKKPEASAEKKPEASAEKKPDASEAKKPETSEEKKAEPAEEKKPAAAEEPKKEHGSYFPTQGSWLHQVA